MSEATVVFWSSVKNFGYAKPDNGTVDQPVFVHVNDIISGRDKINKNSRIRYKLGSFNGRQTAVQVEVLDGGVQ